MVGVVIGAYIWFRIGAKNISEIPLGSNQVCRQRVENKQRHAIDIASHSRGNLAFDFFASWQPVIAADDLRAESSFFFLSSTASSCPSRSLSSLLSQPSDSQSPLRLPFISTPYSFLPPFIPLTPHPPATLSPANAARGWGSPSSGRAVFLSIVIVKTRQFRALRGIISSCIGM